MIEVVKEFHGTGVVVTDLLCDARGGQTKFLPPAPAIYKYSTAECLLDLSAVQSNVLRRCIVLIQWTGYALIEVGDKGTCSVDLGYIVKRKTLIIPCHLQPARGSRAPIRFIL